MHVARAPQVYDAIVVGSGISGGWAAKELCEKGLKTLVLERGRPLQHGTGYVTEHKAPWEFEHRGRLNPEPLEKDYFIQKRRYSCFIHTDLDILLRGLGVQTLLLAGNLTNVCVHYTFADAHQRDYHVRVLEDCVGGSDQRAHTAALEAMEYLQTGARRTSDEVLAAIRKLVAA